MIRVWRGLAATVVLVFLGCASEADPVDTRVVDVGSNAIDAMLRFDESRIDSRAILSSGSRVGPVAVVGRRTFVISDVANAETYLVTEEGTTQLTRFGHGPQETRDVYAVDSDDGLITVFNTTYKGGLRTEFAVFDTAGGFLRKLIPERQHIFSGDIQGTLWIAADVSDAWRFVGQDENRTLEFSPNKAHLTGISLRQMGEDDEGPATTTLPGFRYHRAMTRELADDGLLSSALVSSNHEFMVVTNVLVNRWWAYDVSGTLHADVTMRDGNPRLRGLDIEAQQQTVDRATLLTNALCIDENNLLFVARAGLYVDPGVTEQQAAGGRIDIFSVEEGEFLGSMHTTREPRYIDCRDGMVIYSNHSDWIGVVDYSSFVETWNTDGTDVN